jgi:Tol biopolymer transport system component
MTAAVALASESGQELFQKALVKERAAGNLEEAIHLYQRAAKESAGDRTLAAKSLLAAARCYEKLGKDGATKLYQEVARNYGDLREAATARQRLAALAGAKPKQDPGIVVTQIPIPSNIYAVTNGIQLLYQDRITRNLMLADINGGNQRTVYDPGRRLVMDFSLSGNGKLIAVQLFDYTDNRHGYYVINADGTGLKEIYRASAFREQCQCSGGVGNWSPDGSRFLVDLELNGEHELASIGAGGGSVLKLVRLNPGAHVLNAHYSPDGRYVVYTQVEYYSADRPQNLEIYLTGANGGDSIKLVSHPSADRAVGWTPDGRHVQFESHRTGQPELYAIAVSGGKPAGEPIFILKSSGNIHSGTITRDGTLYHFLRMGRNEVFTVKLDPATGTFRGTPEPISELTEVRQTAAWSGDGAWLAYFSQPFTDGGRAQRSTALTIRNEPTGQERRFSLELILPAAVWSHDGKGLYVWHYRRADLTREVIGGTLEWVSAATGERKPVASIPRGRRFQEVTPGSGAAHLWVEFSDGAPLPPRAGLLQLDPTTGDAKEVMAKDAAMQLTLSPDGKQAAVLEPQRDRMYAISVRPLEGGEWRVISTFSLAPGQPPPSDLSWMPDGSGLRYVQNGTPDSFLMRIPASGGPPVKIGTFAGMDFAARLRNYPDGSMALFRSRAYHNEFWALRNFLPLLKAAK